jgi:ParB family chromosome partitioning protein
MAKKSIVSSFGNFTSQSTLQNTEITVTEKAATDSKKDRVGAGIIGATKRSLTDLREERDELLAAVKNGRSILSLENSQIDPSPFRDRLPDDDNSDYQDFKDTISEEGQIVPITVRCHPSEPERYQTVYGHRRARALGDLGLKIQAILVDYSDRDLVVAQGIENANRQDLSWIEKALFCETMSDAGFKAKDIRAALSVDDAQLSKFRVVIKALGPETIEKIGRAPKIGRPRWLELASLIEGKNDSNLIFKTLSSDKVLSLSSDEKFMTVFNALINRSNQLDPIASKLDKISGDIGDVTFGDRKIRITIDESYAEEFKVFFHKEFDGMVEKFMQSRMG